jgi:ATP-binding cassette subfamily B protein
MIRILKYLKPYRFLILLTIILLFVQAFADLALPSYMADIVNVGIQQGGVENAVPVAIRQSSMDKLIIFMTEADKTRVLSDYTFVDKNSPDYPTYIELYPTLAQEPIYVLNQVSDAT